MRRNSKIVAAVLLAMLATGAHALGRGKVDSHDHASAAHGGSTLTPGTLTLGAASTWSVSTEPYTTGGGGLIAKSTEANAWTGASACPVSALGPCIAGSTLTINCNGNRVEVYGSGTASSGGTGQMVLAVLQNGTFMDGQSATKGFYAGNVAGATASHQVFFTHKSTGAVAAGNVSYCMTCRSNNSTINYPGTDGAYSSVPAFGVRCLK